MCRDNLPNVVGGLTAKRNTGNREQSHADGLDTNDVPLDVGGRGDARTDRK